MKEYFLILLSFSPPLRRMLASQGMISLGSGIFAVLLNLYLKASGYHEDSIGRILALQSLCAALVSIPMGWLADRTSHRTAYLIGLSAIFTGYCLVSQSSEVAAVIAAAIITGSGSGAMMVAVQPFLQEHSRRRQRPYLFSANFTLMLVLGILSGLLAGYLPGFFRTCGWFSLPDERASFQISLMVGAGFVFLAFFPALRLTRGEKAGPAAEAAPPPSPEAAAQAYRTLAQFMLTSGLIGGGAGMIVPYFNLYFQDWAGASVSQIGHVFALGQLGTALGGFSSPWLARAMGLTNGVVLTQLASLPFMMIMAWRHEFWLCAICFIFRGAFMNMSSPMRQEKLMECIPPQFRARASAGDAMAWNMAWAGSMFFSGSIIRHWGYGVSLWVTFACYLLSGVLYYWFFSDTRKGKAGA